MENGIRIVEEYAAKQVPGSTFRVIVDEMNFLHDCGSDYSRNHEKRVFPFNTKEINAMTLSHAHGDHVGELMTLVDQGFDSKIYATHITADLARLQLEQDVASTFFYNKSVRGKRGPDGNYIPWKKAHTREDIQRILGMFVSDSGRAGIPYEKEMEIGKGVSIKFYEAGHIPGSAQTMYMIKEHGKNLLIAHDLGRTDYKILGHPVNDTPFVRFPSTKFGENIDYIVLEATYGDRVHKPLEQSLASLENAINEVNKTKGILLAPAFSIMRTQMFRDFLFRFDEQGKLPRDLMIYTSSPGADGVDKVMLANMGDLDKEAIDESRTPNRSSFSFDKYVRHKKLDETMKVMKERIGKAPTIVIASSGMCDMGRAVPLSREVIQDSRNIIMKLGYSSPGTRMDLMSSGHKMIRYDEGDVEMKARVIEMGGLSGHADCVEQIAHLKSINDSDKGKRFKGIFIKHGEEKACYALAEKIKEARKTDEPVIVMEPHKVYTLD